MIDRSRFTDELRYNPGLMRRIAVIVNGEVGSNAPVEQKMIQAETIFNRAIARNQSIQQVTLNATRDRRGYYPESTFVNGEGALRRSGGAGQFYEQILKPVLAGSDVSTEKLGFAATGNASADVARNGKTGAWINGRYDPRPKYTAHADYGNPKNPETYVQEGDGGRTGFDKIDRLNALASGGSIPRPPGGIPPTTPSTGAVAASAVAPSATPAAAPAAAPPLPSVPPTPTGVTGTPSANYPPSQFPTYRLPVTQATAAGEAVPMPWKRPQGAGWGGSFVAPAAAPAAAAPAAPSAASSVARPPAPAAGRAAPATGVGTSLGEQIIKSMGPDASGLSTFVDPHTGHQFITGSIGGETIMRDVGPLSGRTARQAPAPAPPVSRAPPAQGAGGGVTRPEPVPQSAQVPLPKPRPEIPGQAAPSFMPPPSRPPSVFDEVAQPVPSSLAFAPDLFHMKQSETQRFANVMPRVELPFDNMMKQRANALAPIEAGFLADRQHPPVSPGQAPPANAPAPPPMDRAPPLQQAFQPTTVDQQLRGISPFEQQVSQPGQFPPPQMPPDMQPQQQPQTFVSNTLLPFQQWPPPAWYGDYGGFSGWGGAPSFDLASYD